MAGPSLKYGTVEFLYLPFSAKAFGTGTPATVQVQVAITASNVDTPTTGQWQDAVVSGGMARILLDGTLARGRYFVWLRIFDAPEVPIRQPGTLTIT